MNPITATNSASPTNQMLTPSQSAIAWAGIDAYHRAMAQPSLNVLPSTTATAAQPATTASAAGHVVDPDKMISLDVAGLGKLVASLVTSLLSQPGLPQASLKQAGSTGAGSAPASTATAGPTGTAGEAAAKGFGGLSSKGVDFIYKKEHADGAMIEHPSGGSGVTIGAGYDMKDKKAPQIKSDLMAAGASADVAEKLSKGAGLSGSAASAFVKENKTLLNDKGKDFEVKLMAPELEKAGKEVDRNVKVPITQGMRDALISFTFNCGEGGLQKSGILSKLNSGDKAGAAAVLSKAITTDSTGTQLAGLVSRRKEESAMFSA